MARATPASRLKAELGVAGDLRGVVRQWAARTFLNAPCPRCHDGSRTLVPEGPAEGLLLEGLEKVVWRSIVIYQLRLAEAYKFVVPEGAMSPEAAAELVHATGDLVEPSDVTWRHIDGKTPAADPTPPTEDPPPAPTFRETHAPTGIGDQTPPANP